MFDKLKKIRELQKMQNDLKNEKETTEKDGTRVVVRADFFVEEILLNPSLDKISQEKILKEIINEALQKIQLKLAQKFSGMF